LKPLGQRQPGQSKRPENARASARRSDQPPKSQKLVDDALANALTGIDRIYDRLASSVRVLAPSARLGLLSNAN
jgi:hypothetical protein